MPYATTAELKAVLGITDTASDTILARALDAASRWIDNKTGRKFTLDASDTTKLLYPRADGTLDVIDLVTIVSIKTDTRGDRTYATTLATTDYIATPSQNADGETRYQRISIWPTSSKSFNPARLVQVIGKFGYVVGGATPGDITQACLILASRYFHRKDAPFGILGMADMGQFERISKEDPDVIGLLEPYMRSRFVVVV